MTFRPNRRPPPLGLRGLRLLQAGDVTLRFRLVIGLSFAVVVLITTTALLLLGGYALTEMRRTQVTQQFAALTSLARSHIAAEFGNADVVLDTLAMTDPYPAANEEAALSLARVLKNLRDSSPSVLAIIAALPDGSFSLARKITPEGAAKARALNASGSPAFELQVGVRQGETRSDVFSYVDGDFAVMARAAPVEVTYDTRQRPWYRLAESRDRAAVTPPYRFLDLPYTGLTLSRHAATSPGTVFAVDMTLPDLSASLAASVRLPREQVDLFSADGTLLAGTGVAPSPPSPMDPDAPVVPAASERAAAVFGHFLADPKARTQRLEVASETVLADFAPFEIGGQRLVLVSSLPEAVIREPIDRWQRVSLAVQAGVAGLVFLVALGAAGRISKPILALATEVENIVAFRFSPSRAIESRVWEIQRLAAAVRTLEVTLKAFSSYLPAPFVRSIVDRQELPVLGGRKQTVVVMFSDIHGFTSLAETTPPDRLIVQLSRYFAVIADAVSASGGVVDKYIGDGVMAFWIVAEDGGTAEAACDAVFRASAEIRSLNAEFEAEGLPVLPTRFGLHQGEAMVGNVGARDRMDYTVLGHTVNVASRIEGLNKDFGTTCLVSGAFRRAAGNARDFRLVDTMTVRGAQTPIDLHEMTDLR